LRVRKSIGLRIRGFVPSSRRTNQPYIECGAVELAQTFDWQGRRVAYGCAGDGPPVVFCHGTPWSSWVWQPFAEALAADFTVHLWDMPGYGRSSKRAEHPVDFGVQAEVFGALLAHWGLERPHVVAHDIGGAVSLRANLVGGATYASLLLVDVVAIPPSGSPFYRFVHEYPDLLGQLPAYIHEAVVRAYIQSASHRGLREDDLDALARPWLGDDGQPAFYRQIAHYDERHLVENEQRLDRLDIPVRVLWGADDAWIPTDTGKRVASSIPNATFSLVDNAGHLMHYDAPVVLADELRAWLARQARSD
jgi:pimeloyl-ACP methyl ester carboxylesterase